MKKTFFISVLVLLCSCDDTSTGIVAPEKLIPTDSMIVLIIDAQILESHFMRTFNHPDNYLESLDSSTNKMFEDYGYTKSQFEKSYDYYASNIDVIYQIYEAALDSINFRLSSGNQILPE